MRNESPFHGHFQHLEMSRSIRTTKNQVQNWFGNIPTNWDTFESGLEKFPTRKARSALTCLDTKCKWITAARLIRDEKKIHSNLINTFKRNERILGLPLTGSISMTRKVGWSYRRPRIFVFLRGTWSKIRGKSVTTRQTVTGQSFFLESLTASEISHFEWFLSIAFEM